MFWWDLPSVNVMKATLKLLKGAVTCGLLSYFKEHGKEREYVKRALSPNVHDTIKENSWLELLEYNSSEEALILQKINNFKT